MIGHKVAQYGGVCYILGMSFRECYPTCTRKLIQGFAWCHVCGLLSCLFSCLTKQDPPAALFYSSIQYLYSILPAYARLLLLPYVRSRHLRYSRVGWRVLKLSRGFLKDAVLVL